MQKYDEQTLCWGIFHIFMMYSWHYTIKKQVRFVVKKSWFILISLVFNYNRDTLVILKSMFLCDCEWEIQCCYWKKQHCFCSWGHDVRNLVPWLYFGCWVNCWAACWQTSLWQSESLERDRCYLWKKQYSGKIWGLCWGTKLLKRGRISIMSCMLQF